VKTPSLPPDETARLAHLASLGLVYSPAEERFDRITRLACTVFGVPIALVSLVAADRQWFKSAQGYDESETAREMSFCGHAILGQEALVIPDTLLDEAFADNPLVQGAPQIRFYAGQPLRYKGSAMGTLCLIDRSPRRLTEADLETLRNLASWVENELQISALSESQTRLIFERDQAVRAALVDPLTQAWNRKGMAELLPQELAHAEREGRGVALLLLDVDYFKKINDTHGHAAGDTALREVARRIRAAVRGTDVVVRYGGDEFLVFASFAAADTGPVLAERIRERVCEKPIDMGESGFSLSLTIGVASSPPAVGLLSADLMGQADAALYEAKDAGRNCIRHRRLKGVVPPEVS
jgi:diguanylate cyclase (GGDEF)-like protein